MKMSNQSVTNADFVQAARYFRILFRTCRVRTFTFHVLCACTEIVRYRSGPNAKKNT